MLRRMETFLFLALNSNLELVDSQARNSSGLYAQYKEAVDNEIVPVERERYKSNYEQVD